MFKLIFELSLTETKDVRLLVKECEDQTWTIAHIFEFGLEESSLRQTANKLNKMFKEEDMTKILLKCNWPITFNATRTLGGWLKICCRDIKDIINEPWTFSHISPDS